MAWTRVVVQQDAFHGFPQHCASCLSLEDLEVFTAEASGLFIDRVAYDVPICRRCAARFRKLKALGWPIRFLFLFAGVGIAHVTFHNWTLDWLVPAGCLFLGDMLISAMNLRGGPVRVARKARQATVIFWMSNEQYATEFAAMNSVTYEPVLFAPVL